MFVYASKSKTKILFSYQDAETVCYLLNAPESKLCAVEFDHAAARKKFSMESLVALVYISVGNQNACPEGVLTTIEQLEPRVPRFIRIRKPFQLCLAPSFL